MNALQQPDALFRRAQCRHRERAYLLGSLRKQGIQRGVVGEKLVEALLDRL